MCDYSLELYRSRQAVNEEHYTLHRFRSGTLGFVVESDCTTAICMPAGARLRLAVSTSGYNAPSALGRPKRWS